MTLALIHMCTLALTPIGPSSWAHLATKVWSVCAVPGTLLAAPLLVMLLPRARPWYIRHREGVALYTFLVALAWVGAVRGWPHAAAPQHVSPSVLMLRGHLYLPFMAFALQGRLRRQAALLVVCLFLGLAQLPSLCAAAGCPAACVLSGGGRVLLASCLAPLAFLWCMEQRTRHIFLQRLRNGRPMTGPPQ